MKLVVLIVDTPTLSSLSTPKTQSDDAKSKPHYVHSKITTFIIPNPLAKRPSYSNSQDIIKN
jgi:hypothetical protein